MATKYHGKNAEIHMGTGSPLTLVCAFASWTIGFARPETDVSTFCDDYDTSLFGNSKPTGSFDGFMTKEDFQTIVTATESETDVTLRIVPTSLEPGVYFEGPARLSLNSVGGTYQGAITMSVGFTGNGSWTTAFGFTSP